MKKIARKMTPLCILEGQYLDILFVPWVLDRNYIYLFQVEYSGGFEIINPHRFGQQFVGRVANSKDLLLFYKKKSYTGGYSILSFFRNFHTLIFRTISLNFETF